MAGPKFEAMYQGDCAECGLWWNPGDFIRYDDDDELVHEECYQEQLADRAVTRPRTWTPPKRES